MLNKCVLRENSDLLFPITMSKRDLFALLQLKTVLFLKRLFHKVYHLNIVFCHKKFLIIDIYLVSYKISFALKLFQDLLFWLVIFPIWIFTTAHVFLIFLSHRLSQSFLHLVIPSSSIDIRFEIFSFNTFLMIFSNSFSG